MTARLRDSDLAVLFANAFSSTLDTTVKYFDPALNLAFIITGDIKSVLCCLCLSCSWPLPKQELS